MSELNIPDHWAEVTLKDICSIITDGTHQTPTYAEKGVLFLSSKNVTSGQIDWVNVKYIPHQLHQELSKRLSPKQNDILLAKNGTTGVGAIVDRDVVFDIYVSLALLRLYKEINPKFVLHFINSPLAKSQFNSRLKGVGVQNLHLKEIREVKLGVPSKDEQERIVQKIESCFQKINETGKALNKVETLLRKYRESLLAKAFRGELVPQDSKDEPALKLLEKIRAERIKNSNGKKIQEFASIADEEKPFDLPEGWEWVRFGELISEARYGTSEKCAETRIKGDVPVLRMGNIKDSLVEFSKLKYLSRSKLDDSLILQPGDILFNRTNSIELVGKSAVFPELNKEGEWSYAGYLIRVRLCSYLNPYFFNIYINSSYGRAYVQKVATNTGEAQSNVNAEKLKSMPVPLAPTKTQNLFDSLIKAHDDFLSKQLDIVHSKLSLLAKAKESILTNAFQGDLVPRINIEGNGQELVNEILKNRLQLDPVVSGKKTKKTIKKIAKVKK